MVFSSVAAAKAEISRCNEGLRAVAATTIARWWRSIKPQLAHARDVEKLKSLLRASIAWRPQGGSPIKAVVVFNFLCDNDPTKAASGFDEAEQLQQSVEGVRQLLKCPILLHTFKRGPHYKTSNDLKVFLKACGGEAVHVVVTGHGGVTWGHYVGKALVPHVSFLAPSTSGAQKGAIWSLSRPALLEWVAKFMTQHDYGWPRESLSVSLDVCQICADLAESPEQSSGYVAGVWEGKTKITSGKTIRFRGPIHAAFATEMKVASPAFFLESGPFQVLMDLASEVKGLRERVAELEPQSPLDLDISISSLMEMLDIQSFE
jgi:hypothetical protein